MDQQVIHQLPAATPATDGKLFDVLHEMYGIGSYVEGGPLPWWKFRAVEASKVKACRVKNGRSLADLYVAALYCRATGVDVRAVTYLTRHVPKAWAWWDTKTHQALQTPDEMYSAAIRAEAANQDPSWLNRLLRATPAAREEVLREWRSR